MKVNLNKNQEGQEPENEEVTPASDAREPEGDAEVKQPEPNKDLEAVRLELAEVRGELRAARETAKPAVDDQDLKDRAAKQSCLADINGLDDMTFQDKYKMSKLAATNALHDYDREKEQKKSAQTEAKLAEMEAKSELLAKYPGLAKSYAKIKENALADLTAEAKKDPEKLKRAIEREFLVVEREEILNGGKQPEKGGDPMRRRPVNDFAKPNNEDRRQVEKDELAPELREIGAKFGITKESQRKQFLSPYIPMDMGNGIVFKDPKRGFEKVPQK